MIRCFDRRLALVVALIAGLVNPPCSGAEPGSSSPAGMVRLASGPTAHYAYHYDRNALAELVRAGDALIARTDSGNLLRFDRATLKLTKESFGPVPVTCLGRGEGDIVLAGFADGRVGRIDPASLAMTELARLPAHLQWVGAVTAGAGEMAKPRVVAVVEQKKRVKNDEGELVEVPFSMVHDAGSGKTYDVEARSQIPDGLGAGAFLLDSKHRLWLGADNGEWGGWWARVDLDTGQVVRAQESGSGIEGFSELHDGQVWVFGGMTHLEVISAFIRRVDPGHAGRLYSLDNGPLFARQMKDARKNAGLKEPVAKGAPEPEPPFPTDRPYWPITHVLDDPGTGTIVVVAAGGIYRTDARLARWEKVHEIKIGNRSGQVNAPGEYLSVRSVLRVEEPGKPMGLLFATGLDGLIRLADGKQTVHALPGQLGAEVVRRIESSTEGVLVFEGMEDDPWQLRDGSWSTVSFAPPFEKAPDAPVVQGVPSGPNWSASRVLVGRDGAIFTVSWGIPTPGTRATARWRGGKAEILGRQSSGLDLATCFLTPDGRLWNANQERLWRFAGGRWVHAAPYDWPPRATLDDWSGIGWGLRAVNDTGPPWILHDDNNQLLLRLAYGPDIKEPRLEVILLTEAGQDQRLKVRDAIAWNKGELLLATDRGLRTFAIDGGKLATPTLNTGGRVVSRLVRDGRGRLWLGGEGLAVLEADGKTLHPLDELPMLGRSKVEAIAADPSHPDGAIVAVADRGVVFVRVDE